MVALLKMPSWTRSAEPEADGVYRIDRGRRERRQFERKEVRYAVEGHRMDHTVTARRQPLVTMAMRDLSVGGLSAVADRPLEEGERVSVSFPPQGLNRGWDAFGRVVRCEPSAMGYRVAVEFDTLPAA